jgi:hypothetical protein
MKSVSFTMRFAVTRDTVPESMRAETTVRRSAQTVDQALALGRGALEAKGWTVLKCTDCRTKLQTCHVGNR